MIIIMQFYILMPLWMFALRRFNPATGIAFSILVSVVLGFNLNNIIALLEPNYEFRWSDVIFTKYLFYWVLGCYAGMNYAAFKKAVLDKKLLITVVFILAGVMDIFLAYKTFNMTMPWMEEIHIIYCSSAIIFFFMLTSLLAGSRVKMTWLARAIDSESYNIYLSHCLVILWLNDYLITEVGMENVVERFKYVTAAAFLVPIVFWLLWWLIKLGAGKLTSLIKSAVRS